MKIIGLTGQSGSGKSMVSEILRSHGYTVINADGVYHSLITKDSPLSVQLADRFGVGILTDGEIDRKKLSKLVFSSQESLNDLNRITHKAVIEKTEEILSHRLDCGDTAVFYDAPQLFEAGFDSRCDHIIAVLADDDIRLSRIEKRDGIDRDDILKRFANQKSADFFEKNCDILIYNNGTVSELEKKTADACLYMGLKWERL